MENMVNFWKDKRVLVTGATGLVGSWLIKELLECGALVVGLVRDADPRSELVRSGGILKIHVVNGMLEDFHALDRAILKHGVDTVFHLGAQPIVTAAGSSPLPTFEANIRGTYNLLEACRMHMGTVERIVVASSDKAYGESSNLPYTENMPLMGRYPYEVSKSCADMLAQSYFVTYGLPVTISRCGNIYGGGDLNWTRLIPGTIRSLLRGERPIIRSDGTYLRDYIYIKDVVRAYMMAAENILPGEAFNFGPEQPYSVNDIVRRIQTILKSDISPDIQATATGEIHDQYLSSEKAARLLGWIPSYGIMDGLTETVEWYKEYLK